jgi:hypothetical protein
MLEAHHANEPAQVADEGAFVLAIESNADAFLQSGSAVRMLCKVPPPPRSYRNIP